MNGTTNQFIPGKDCCGLSICLLTGLSGGIWTISDEEADVVACTATVTEEATTMEQMWHESKK